MADARIRAIITAEDRASGVINGFSKTSIAAFGAIAGVAQAVTAKAIDVISDSVGTAIKRVDTLNNSSRVFANMGFRADDVKTAMDKLNTSILGLPTPLDAAVRGMQMIGSTTGDIGKAQAVFSALNDAIIGFGGTADDVNGAVLQLSQAFSNGRIDAQTWNSLMQNGLGPTLNAVAKQMGKTTGALKEGLSDGKISVSQFQDALIGLDKNGGGGLKSLQTIAHDATAGINTGMENAKTAIARGMADVIQAIGPENISRAITAVGSAVEKLLKSFVSIADFFKKNPLLSAAGLGAMGAVILTTLVPALIAWAAAAASAAIATVAATWPILLIGAAIGAVAYLVVTHWETIKNAFGTAIGWIGDRVNWLKDHFWETVGFIIGFFASLPIKIPLYVAQAIGWVIGYIASINWGNVFSAIGRAFEGVWQWVKDSASKAWQFIKNINWGDVLTGIGKGIGNAIIGLIEGAINGAIKGIPGMKGIHLPRFASGVQNFGGGLAVVGERGPELVNLPGGSSVIPNNKIGGVGGGSTINISINSVYSAGTEMEKRKFAKDIFQALQDVAGSKNMSIGDMLA